MRRTPLSALAVTTLILLSFTVTAAQNEPALSAIDRTRLAETFRLGDQLGDRVWPGWSKAPFAVLLVTPDYEFLMRHPKPSDDFVKVGYDSLLKSDVYYRKRQFETGLLATFPAVGGISTIVVGQAENTMPKTSTPWIVILLHEHFHQMQDSQPNFYPEVNALNLARGDQSGSWMLNYPFPYDRTEVQQQFALTSRLLADAIKSPKATRPARLREYLAAREKFQSLVSAEDYKYFSFQLWKEGIARYTEYQVARLAAAKYRPSKEFVALSDYTPLADAAQNIYERIFKQLQTQKLGESKREVVYSFGAGEGLLLDQINPAWRKRYFSEKFDLRKFLPRG